MKKLLALVLALVMTLGLATVGTSAAYSDFTDTADVSFEEAMKVMNAVGVFVGDGNKLDPKGNLTRAQAAKLIAYLALGESVAEALPKTGSKFTDAPDGAWFTGYVNYMADAGYTNGTSATTFDPNGSLTGYQFGAFLLAVLGYDRAAEGMIGSGWETKVAVALQNNGITDGVDKLGSATLTREEAAQFCLNALSADMVYYDGGVVGTTVTTSDGTVVTTGSNGTRKVATNAGGGSYGPYAATNATLWDNGTTGFIPADRNGNLQLGEKLYGGKLLPMVTGKTDSFGRPATKWYYEAKHAAGTNPTQNDSGTNKTLVSTTAETADYKVVLTKNYTGSSVQALLRTLTKNDNLTYTFNAATFLINSENSANGVEATDLAANMKVGNVVEVFTTNNAVDKIVVTKYDYATIATINTAISAADAAKGVTHYITLGTAATTVSNNKELPGFDAETYVKDAKLAIVKKTNGDVLASEVLTKVSGSMSAFTGTFYTNATTGFDSITVGGTKYTAANGANYGAATASFDTADSYDLYLNADGYVIYSTSTTATVDLKDVYYVVDITGTGSNNAAKNVYMTEATVNGYPGYNVYAQLVNLDGTVSGVLVGQFAYFGASVTATADSALTGTVSGTTYYPISDGGIIGADKSGATSNLDAAFFTATGTTTVVDTGDTSTNGTKFYTYKGVGSTTTVASVAGLKGHLVTISDVSSESYKTLSDYSTKVDLAYDGSTALTAKSTSFTGGTSSRYYINSDTKFLLVNGTLGSIKTKTYTGPITLAAAATEQQSSGNAVVYTTDSYNNRVASYVVLKSAVSAAGTNSNDEIFYVSSSSYSTVLSKDGKTNARQYSAYDLTGEKVNILVPTSKTLSANNFYTATSKDAATDIYTLNNGTAEISNTLADASGRTATVLYDLRYAGRTDTTITAKNLNEGDGYVDTTQAGAYANFQDVKTDKLAKVIDLRSADTKADDVYTSDIDSLDALYNAAEIGKANKLSLDFDAYVTYADGVKVIFVKGFLSSDVDVTWAAAVNSMAATVVKPTADSTTAGSVTVATPTSVTYGGLNTAMTLPTGATIWYNTSKATTVQAMMAATDITGSAAITTVADDSYIHVVSQDGLHFAIYQIKN